jgi:hypothetical protein
MHALVRLGALPLLLTGCFSYTITTPEAPPVDARTAVRPDAAEVCVTRTSLEGGTRLPCKSASVILEPPEEDRKGAGSQGCRTN